MWELGVELRSSGLAESAFACRAILLEILRSWDLKFKNTFLDSMIVSPHQNFSWMHPNSNFQNVALLKSFPGYMWLVQAQSRTLWGREFCCHKLRTSTDCSFSHKARKWQTFRHLGPRASWFRRDEDGAGRSSLDLYIEAPQRSKTETVSFGDTNWNT